MANWLRMRAQFGSITHFAVDIAVDLGRARPSPSHRLRPDLGKGRTAEGTVGHLLNTLQQGGDIDPEGNSAAGITGWSTQARGIARP